MQSQRTRLIRHPAHRRGSWDEIFMVPRSHGMGDMPPPPILCEGRRYMGCERLFTPRTCLVDLVERFSTDTADPTPSPLAWLAGRILNGYTVSWHGPSSHNHPLCARGAEMWAVNAYSHLVRCLVDRIEQLSGRETSQGFTHCDLLRGPTLGKAVTTHQLSTCGRTRLEMIKYRHMRPFTVWEGGG